MTYFETPRDRDAFLAGVSTDTFEDRIAAMESDDTPDEVLDPERFVSEADYFAPTEQDWRDWMETVEWMAFQGFHA